MDPLDPEAIADANKMSGVVAGLVKEHKEAMLNVGFSDEEAWELAMNYHWCLLTGAGEGDD